MRILIVDNTIDLDSWGAEDIRRLIRGATVDVRRAPQEDLPSSPRGYDRIILTGSKTSCLEDGPWISKLHQFVQGALNENVPYLGVCFGHQTLARVLGGKETCRRGQSPEYGWSKIELLDDSPLFAGLPKTFYSFSAHVEEVASPPKELRVLARSEACAVQAFQLQDRPVFGIQFHPEKDLESAKKTFEQRKKAKKTQGLLHPNASEKLYDPSIGTKILANFVGTAEALSQ